MNNGFRALLCAVGSYLGPANLTGVESVPLVIQERAGVSRTNEWVSFGVPLPRSWQVTNAAGLVLRDDLTQPIPAQMEILARWGGPPSDPTKPAKWVLVTRAATIEAHGHQTAYLEVGPATHSPGSGISISPAPPGGLRVDTGAAVFLLSTNSFNLFEQVTVADEPVLTPLASSDAIVYQGMDGTNIVFATTHRPARACRAEIERNGPLYAVIKVRGSLLDAGQRALLDYTARYHFYAGKSEARVDFTVENNYPVMVGEGDQPVNVHNLGATNSIYVGSLQLALRLAPGPAPLVVAMENGVKASSPAHPVRLYQDSSGLPSWNVYTGWVGWETNVICAPRLQSYCTQRGYAVTGLETPVAGDQSQGWAAVYREGEHGPFTQVAVRDFWQNFPKAIEARPEGTVAVDLFPNGSQFRHNLRVGEQKTHTLWFRFGMAGGASGSAELWAKTLNAPLAVQVPPSWIVQSQALGEVPVSDVGQWPLYERYVRVAFEPNPVFDPAVDDPSFGNTTLRQAIEYFNFFGWQDYGDVPLDYEAFGPQQAGQMNLKYWYLYGLLVQYCRSAEPQWLDLALPAAWHLADIDYLHIPDEGIQHWVHGAYFGHSNHGEPGNLNPNRNSNSPSVDLFFGVPDLLLAFYVTGEIRFREVALEGLEAMLNLSQFSDFTSPFLYRERPNLIFAYLEGYRQTGDARWLAALRKIVGETANVANKGWLTSPATYRPAEDWQWLSSFQLSQVLWSLGRYLAFVEEYGSPDDLGVTNALTTYADFILRYFTSEYQPGRAAAWSAFYFYDPHEDPYLEIDDWALATADALAFAYKYSGRSSYLETAAKFYATGTIDPVWLDDPPVYLASKDLVNALNWGLAYMRISHPDVPTTPEALHVSLKTLSSGQMLLQWNDLGPSYRYAVEFTEALPASSWTVLTGKDLIATNSWSDMHSSLASGFWRVRAEPGLNKPD